MSEQQDKPDLEPSSTNYHAIPVENENRDLSLDTVSTEEKASVLAQEVENIATENQNQEEANFYGQREKGTIRLVLLGRTGSGKSATGNTILDKKEFLSKASGSSITEQCQRAEKRIADHRLLIIDTPGLYDTNLSKGETTLEIIRCLRMSAPGPHAFLLVLRLDRFTQEEIDTFTNLFDLFGEKMSSFAIIIFTKIDDLEGEDTSIDEFINTSNKHLKHFISKVDGRYTAFNNRGTEEQKRQQVANFTKILDEMIQKNNGQHYTNKMYQDAEAELQRTIKEVEKKKQREVAQIVSKCKDKITEIETSNRLREKKKEETQSILKDIQLKLIQMNKGHDKELFEVRQEAKKMEEMKIQELHLREEENRILMKEIKINQREAEEQMKILENCRQTAIDDCYKSLMQQTIEAVMKLFQLTKGDIGSTEELRKSLKESKMKMQQNEESDRIDGGSIDPEEIFRQFFGTEHNEGQLKSQTNHKSGCLIM